MLILKKILILSISIILAISTLGYPTVAYAAGEATGPEITYIPSYSNELSQKGWSQSDEVVLASGWNFPDALAGSAFSMVKDIPLLFTSDVETLDSVSDNSTWDEIVRLKAKKVYILGGTGAVSKNIENNLKSKGLEVVRINGSDRFGTAKKIGDEIINIKNTNTAFLANAYDYVDACTISTFAGQIGGPIILSDKDTLNATTQNAIKEWNVKTIYIAGGTGAISQKIEDKLKSQGIKVTRLGGKNRYETAKTIIKKFKPNITELTLVSDYYFEEVFAGAVYGYKTNRPIMLFDKGVEDSIKEFVWECSDVSIMGSGITDSTIIPSTVTPIRYPTDPREAKVFATSADKLVTINKNASYDTNISKLNGMIGNTFGVWYRPTMTNNGLADGYATFKHNTATNTYGLEIFGWRNSKDSGINENHPLNAILETFYFMCGDKEVSYALWEWVDACAITGDANSKDFGFTDIKWTSTGGTITMNGIDIDVTIGAKNMTFYFK